MLIVSMMDHGERTLISPFSLGAVTPADEFLFSIEHRRILEGLRNAEPPTTPVRHWVVGLTTGACRKTNCQLCQMTFSAADVSVWLCWGFAGHHWYRSHLRLFRTTTYDLRHECQKRGVDGVRKVIELAASVEVRRRAEEIRTKDAEMRIRGGKPVL